MFTAKIICTRHEFEQEIIFPIKQRLKRNQNILK